ncbi:hypothetical protein [Arthrobacter rhizosphaerae]|uniref:hypothetical protein n=1 Tax=Arthrobacter rhizosphaerae TaxID=2855490 RepID=UPI001FF55713|nr:hypothetical protein [Arthrobacter rhizosphaerae]
MKRFTGSTYLAVAALALMGVTVPHASAPNAAAADEVPEVLGVNFSQTTGNFRGGATGTLYGFGDEGAPTPALINGARITNTSQKAPFGTQHPSGDSLKVEDGFFAKGGQDMYVYVQDYYPDWPYNGGVRPGDSRSYNQATGTYTNAANGIWDYLEVVELVATAVATQSDHPEKYIFIPFNEPDLGNWYGNWTTMKTTFLNDWNATHAKIQSVYAAKGLGHAKIGGPGDAGWKAQRSSDILDFAKASNTLPDIFIWHELGIQQLATFRSHLTAYRNMETAKGIPAIPVNITEYGMLRDMGVPGQLIQWFAMFEDEKVDAQTAYWNYAGNFSDNSARPNGANAGWWMFKWYGDLQGSTTVNVTPPQLNVADTLQGIGAVDNVNKRATVLFGGTSKDVSVDLSGIDPAVFGSKVDVEVREAAVTGAEGLAGTPRVIKALEGVTVTDGKLKFDVDTYDRYAAYQVIITPEQGRPVTVDGTWSQSVEAENTALTNATAFTQDPQAGGGWKFLASGGKDVGAFNTVQSKADWTVTVPRTGTYRYQVIGSTPGVPGRHALFVDNVNTKTVQYTADLALNATSKWQYRGSAEVTVQLTAGTHVLSLRTSADGTTKLPNSDITLDKFVLTDVASGEVTAYAANTLRPFGGAKLTWGDAVLDNPAASRGSMRIQGSGQRADTYVTAWDSGYYDITATYRTAAASDLRLTANGKIVANFAPAQKGSWKSTVRVHLSQGINELELTSAAGAWVESVTTTRAAASDSAAVTIEAENATLRGRAAVRTLTASTGSNASGMKLVGNVGAGAADYIEIARQAKFSATGDYNMVVRYANAELSGSHDYNPQVVDRKIRVGEGGNPAEAGSAFFRYTYSWNSFWERTIPLKLTTTTGALTLGNSSAYAPDIDSVTIAPIVVGAATTVPAA